ncbi:MAG: 50S ribosomal protein L6 [Lentisphaerae bacterium GWF2_45_14]|nr:MAG: 50S ribosomal protein L6 [Lentisphaerae bacterium GWF2_45_14]
MSRIGNKIIELPSGVKVSVSDGVISVEAKGKLSTCIPPIIDVKVEDGTIRLIRANDNCKTKALHGLTRSLINNMVIGVTKGFKKELQIVGIGYKAQLNGSKLTLALGYSHPVEYTVPKGVTLSVVDNTKIFIEGIDKQLVGEVAATIRRFRKPEPYKGKGIRYSDERITLKEGKTTGK